MPSGGVPPSLPLSGSVDYAMLAQAISQALSDTIMRKFYTPVKARPPVPTLTIAAAAAGQFCPQVAFPLGQEALQQLQCHCQLLLEAQQQLPGQWLLDLALSVLVVRGVAAVVMSLTGAAVTTQTKAAMTTTKVLSPLAVQAAVSLQIHLN